MKEKLPALAGAVLGLLFVVFGLNFFLKFIAVPGPPEGSPAAAFMGSMYSTGFLGFVKVLEIAGGLLVAVPRTRKVGLLILTPIVVNIVAYHAFFTNGAGLTDPPVVLVAVLCVYLLVSARRSAGALLN